MDREDYIKLCEAKLKDKFASIDEVAFSNQSKVCAAFAEERVAVRHFSGTSGYGYGDDGRDTLGALYARVFGAEAGIVSPHLLSGTHALTVALFGILRPNDGVLCVSGMPYDTLHEVIWGVDNGSLQDFGINFECVALSESGKFVYSAVGHALSRSKNLKVVYIQRSRGYELRDALTVDEIGEMCIFLRKKGFKGCIFVDNCYGEFVEKREPVQVGADIIVGSLIKNPGGGLAQTGGYICGGAKYIELVARRLTAPSIGAEVGSHASGYQYYYQGLFMAPHTVAQALKCSLLIGEAMAGLGYKNYPPTDRLPADITRAIEFGDAEKMINFIREVQCASPIDGFVTCEPWDMPGYNDKIIMAAGTFVSGASIELSADGPVKPPYIAYFQGGLTYEHGKYALLKILDKLM